MSLSYVFLELSQLVLQNIKSLLRKIIHNTVGKLIVDSYCLNRSKKILNVFNLIKVIRFFLLKVVSI